jgi:hypothetical protein
MTKELFIESIEALEAQYRHDDKCADALQSIYQSSIILTYDNHKVCNQLIKLLRIEMVDDHDESWIDYYIDELDFGRKWKPGMIVISGVRVRLKTPEDLYKLLTRQNIRNGRHKI